MVRMGWFGKQSLKSLKLGRPLFAHWHEDALPNPVDGKSLICMVLQFLLNRMVIALLKGTLAKPKDSFIPIVLSMLLEVPTD
jgi:hypothetical protein